MPSIVRRQDNPTEHAKGQAGENLQAAINLGGQAITKFVRGVIWGTIWVLLGSANGLRLLDGAVSEHDRSLTVED